MPEEFFTPLQEYEKARKMAQKQYRASASAGRLISSSAGRYAAL